jgi:tartrate dehydratase alpha subunit/fumarate hydratase class I-like protein
VMVRHFGTIDALVASAGIAEEESREELLNARVPAFGTGGTGVGGNHFIVDTLVACVDGTQ